MDTQATGRRQLGWQVSAVGVHGLIEELAGGIARHVVFMMLYSTFETGATGDGFEVLPGCLRIFFVGTLRFGSHLQGMKEGMYPQR